MIRNWKTISTKTILSHPRHVVYEDIAELPNGDTTDYVYFEGHHAAMVIAQRADGKFFVQKEYNYPTKSVLYQFPGGGIEDREDPKQGAAREFAEEGQMQGNLKLLGSFYMNNRRHDGKMFVYLATELKEASATPDNTEEFEDFWFTEAEIDELIRNGEFLTHTGLAGWALYKTYTP